jgi:transposase, IS30 family
MQTQYSHLSETERIMIETLRMYGGGYAAIGRAIGRDRSTVMRECKRGHCDPFGRYLAVFGQRYYANGRRNAGLLRRKLGADLDSSMWQLVRRGLRVHWSPQQIAGRMRMLDPLRGPLLASAQYVSHETIYRAIYGMPRSAQRTEMITQLRQSRAGRRRRSRGQQRFVGLQNFTPISQRPQEIEQRLVPGHWEGDLMEGARGTRAVIATLVERSSRLVRLVKLEDGTAHRLLQGVTQRLRQEQRWMCRSLTYDRGTEMARHEDLAKALKIQVYICDPYRPWQRGANENTNGLIRQYLPKGTDMAQVTLRQLEAIEYMMNNRPRRVLGYRTPQEVFNQLQAEHRVG